jgi:hypothetical protein
VLFVIIGDWNHRRWAQLRNGVWISILFHMALLGGIVAIRKSPLTMAIIIDPSGATMHDEDHPIYFKRPLCVQEKLRSSPSSTPELRRLPLEHAESEKGTRPRT